MSKKSKKARAAATLAHPKVPSFCVHKRSGNAFTKHAGRQHWFGPADDPQAKVRYQQFIAALLATGAPPKSADEPEVSYTVADPVARAVLMQW